MSQEDFRPAHWGARDSRDLPSHPQGCKGPAAVSLAPMGRGAAVWSWPFQAESWWHVLTVGAGCKNSRDRWSPPHPPAGPSASSHTALCKVALAWPRPSFFLEGTQSQCWDWVP